MGGASEGTTQEGILPAEAREEINLRERCWMRQAFLLRSAVTPNIWVRYRKKNHMGLFRVRGRAGPSGGRGAVAGSRVGLALAERRLPRTAKSPRERPHGKQRSGGLGGWSRRIQEAAADVARSEGMALQSPKPVTLSQSLFCWTLLEGESFCSR